MAANDVWICGASPDEIYQRLNGVWQAGIAGPAGQTSIRGIAFDENNDVWICGQQPDEIYQRLNGVWQAGIAGPPGQTFITGIAFDENNDIWVCGTTPDQIYQRLNGVWQAGIPGPTGQTVIIGIAFDENNDVWICGQSPDEIYQRLNGVWQAGIAGPPGQTSITDIAFDENNDVWICGSSPDQIYQRLNGAWQTGIAGPTGQTTITGIAFEPPPLTAVPATPDAPTVTSVSTSSIQAVGVEPDDGGESISSYDWRYRETGALTWIDSLNQTNLTQVFAGLDASTEYEVQFRATNSVGDSEYSLSGTATTDNPPLAIPFIADKSGFTGVAVNELLPVASGGAGGYSYALTGLPSTLSFSPTTRRITGTPTTAETLSLTYTATDSDNDTLSRDFDFVFTTALVLADSDDTGLDVDCKALLVVSNAGAVGNFIYEDADRGGTDTPLDGELGLGTDETLISGIRRRTATLLQLNDNNNPAALDIGAYFSTGGAGNDLTIYIQTLADGEISFPATNASFSRVDQVRFTMPANVQTLFDNLTSGDRLIFKAARPAVTQQQIVLTGDADLGSPTAAADLNVENPQQQIALAGSADLGSPTAAADLNVENPQLVALSGDADLGNPTASADLSVENPQLVALSGDADLGNPTASADLSIENPIAGPTQTIALGTLYQSK